MNIVFIVKDTYQAMQAVSWAETNKKDIKLFNIGKDFTLKSYGHVHAYKIDEGDLYRTVANVLHTQLGEDQVEFFRSMYSPDVELHVFDYIDLFFQLGYTDIILHDKGDSSYRKGKYEGYIGNDDPYAVAQVLLVGNDGGDYNDGVEQQDLFSNMDKEVAAGIAQVLQVYVPEVPENTVLYVHNEPDEYRYTAEQIDDIHRRINKLLFDIKKRGYILWVKDHHKRPGKIDLSVADYVVECPVELLDTSKFSKVLSVRSKCVDYLQGNCYNGLTRDAVTYPENGFYGIYCRGIQKIYNNAL